MMARPSSILWPVCGMIATATAFFTLQQQSYLTERREKYEGDSREAVLLQKIALLESSLERLHQRTTRRDEHSKSENSEKLPPHYLWHAPTICLNISILVFGVAEWTNIFVHHPVGPDGYPPRPHAVSTLSHPCRFSRLAAQWLTLSPEDRLSLGIVPLFSVLPACVGGVAPRHGKDRARFDPCCHRVNPGDDSHIGGPR